MTAKERLIKLAESNLANVRDNLYRAQRNALCMDSTKPYGQSGHTLDEIIRAYKKNEKEALETLAEAQK